MKSKEDLKRARSLLKGNEVEFHHFFNEYYPKLFRFILSRTQQDYDLSDELTQQTLCQAIDKLHTFEGRASLFTWMCQISRGLISAHFRKTKRRNKIVVPVTDNEEFRSILDNIAMNEKQQPESITENEELKTIISDILDHLPANYGDILEWKYVENLSVKEIAEKLDTSMVSVQSSLARARNAFKNVMKQILQNDILSEFLFNRVES